MPMARVTGGSPMTCNVDNLEVVERNAVYDHFRIKLSDDTASDLVALGGAAGTITGSVTTILVEAGIIASAGTIIGAAVVAIIAAELAWIATQNNGCGVTIDIYLAPSAVPPFTDIPYHVITSQ